MPRTVFDPQEPLSILDQTGRRRYTRLLYTFPLPDTMDAFLMNSIVAKFRIAVQDLLTKWPFLKYFVTQEDGTPASGPIILRGVNEGALAMEARTANLGREFDFYNVLSVKGLKDWSRSSAPIYSYLDSLRLPPSKLDPREFFHIKEFINLNNPIHLYPIYHIGLNFVQGGLVLAISYVNCVLDAQAHSTIFAELARLIREPSSSSRGNIGSAEETGRNIQEIGHLLSRTLQSEMSDGDDCDELSYNSRHDLSRSRLPPNIVGEYIFSLDCGKIRKLSSYLLNFGEFDTRPFTSYTDFETISALFWCAITRARHLESSPAEFESRIGLSLDGRSYLGMVRPELYVRNATFCVAAKLSSEILLDGELGAPGATIAAAAFAIREAQKGFNKSLIQKQLVFMAKHNDKPGHIRPNVDLTDEYDISFTSLIGCGGNEDFGMIPQGLQTVPLGKPQYVRTVVSKGGNGQCILLPRREMREVSESEKPFEVYVQLRKDQMELLRYELQDWTEKVLE